MVTGWFAPGRFWLIGGIRASGASVLAPHADGWYSVRGAGTVPSLFMQLAWPGGMSLQAEWPSVFAVVSSIARELFRPRGRPNWVHQCFGDVSYRWAHWAHAGRDSLATEHLCMISAPTCAAGSCHSRF